MAPFSPHPFILPTGEKASLRGSHLREYGVGKHTEAMGMDRLEIAYSLSEDGSPSNCSP